MTIQNLRFRKDQDALVGRCAEVQGWNLSTPRLDRQFDGPSVANSHNAQTPVVGDAAAVQPL
jgi:hypothetical protein